MYDEQMEYAMDLRLRVADNLTTAVLVFNESLNICYINPAAEMLLDISANQAMDMPASELFPNNERFITSLARSLKGVQPYTERELVLKLQLGASITVDCMVSPFSESELNTGVLVELHAIDRHKRISREESLSSQYQATKTMVRGLAHEINNPLGGLRGAAQLLERELSDDGLKEYTRIIIGEADRLQTLLKRINGPNELPHKSSINIHEVLQHVRSLIVAEVNENIVIDQDYDPSLPEVQADRDQLIQAVLNIVRNSVQAVEDKGRILLRTRIQRMFTIGQKQHKLVIRIDIIDNGPGIPEDMVENIFYPMVTGRAEGTGLGLSIAQSIINQHDGLIEYSSEPGNTVFSLYIPVETGHDR